MKISSLKSIITFTMVLMVAVSANAAPVDLSSWIKEGNGNWILQSGNNAVLQTDNGPPTVFHNGQDSQGKTLSGKIRVQGSDDDYIGFVLGYNAGDLNNPNADYILIDWKKQDQNFYGVAKKGLAISRVTGELKDDAGAWAHDSSMGVTELQRGATLGSTGWEYDIDYDFDITFTPNLIEVYVNNNLELSITGSFNDGSFGFYNYSQANVLYSAIDENVVPIPGAVWLFGPGLGALFFAKKKKG